MAMSKIKSEHFIHDYNAEPYEGYLASNQLKELKALKAKRISGILNSILATALKYRRNYMASSADDISIETEEKSALFAEYLYYIHLPMYCECL